MWLVGTIYKDEFRPFYQTENFVLARRMFLMLIDMGYKSVATNAHWGEK